MKKNCSIRTIPPVQPRGRMNKLECSYRDHLEVLKQCGEILDYQYEPFALRLANRTTYSPDFLVVYPDRMELHETKGYWHDDARVKWKVAADKFPWFRFVAVQRKRKEWVYEVYGE